jgi:quercetin dioxygenase-like cupin family protein
MEYLNFVNSLASEGFAEPVKVSRDANGYLDSHTHPFEAKALILEGEIRIVVSDLETTYRPGDVFQLAENTPHAEFYGPHGVTYLVGRKSSR